MIDNNDNKYYYNNVRVPRVSDILNKCLGDKDGLVQWANYMGKRGLDTNDILEKSSYIGTYIHGYINNILNREISSIECESTNSIINGIRSFNLWWNTLIENGCNPFPVYTELTLTDELFGGTFDAIININGRNFLVDFKTSNSIRLRYFLQLSAYKYLINKYLNIDIDGCIILKLSKSHIQFEEYVLDRQIKKHNDFILLCENTFINMANQYKSLVELDSFSLF